MLHVRLRAIRDRLNVRIVLEARAVAVVNRAILAIRAP
jgi:hypothetical protein